MSFDRLTRKSQEALAAAQALAVRRGQQQVDVEHLLAALTATPDGIVPRLLARLELPAATLTAELEAELARRPALSGGGAEPGKLYVTPRLQQLLVAADDQARRLKDEYVSVEHFVLAMLEEKP